jgi:hypothetical protein
MFYAKSAVRARLALVGESVRFVVRIEDDGVGSGALPQPRRR